MERCLLCGERAWMYWFGSGGRCAFCSADCLEEFLRGPEDELSAWFSDMLVAAKAAQR